MLREQAQKEGLNRIGRTKKQMIENLAMHRITGKYDKYKDHVTRLAF